MEDVVGAALRGGRRRGRSGHTEAVQVYFDDSVSYETILDTFWGSIDPTIVNGQGNDHGSQVCCSV